METITNECTFTDAANEDTLTVRLNFIRYNSGTSSIAKLASHQITCAHWTNDNETKKVKAEINEVLNNEELCKEVDGKMICKRVCHIEVQSTKETLSAEDADGKKPGPLLRTEFNGFHHFSFETDDYEKPKAKNEKPSS
ncbi:MAG: hypothetical protein ACSHX4_03870 [Opitutaceae bacterium]